MHKIAIILAATLTLVGASVCITGAASSDAGKIAASDDMKPLCEDFIRELSNGNKDAFDLIWKRMTRPEEAKHAIDAQRQAADIRYAGEKLGKYLGCELVQEKHSGNSLRKYIYAAKYEKDVLQWTVVLYRPQDEWKIVSFRWTPPGDSLS